MAVFEVRKTPNIIVTAGDLQVLSSGVVNFTPEKGFRVDAGGVKIEFVFQNSEQGVPEIVRNAIPESLTFQYVIKGAIPSAPAGMGLKYPDAIGTVGGIPIHFSFALSVLVNDQKAIVLNYAVYAGPPVVVAEAQTHEEAKHD